jgi:putative SOS response-associated peptidase YedK
MCVRYVGTDARTERREERLEELVVQMRRWPWRDRFPGDEGSYYAVERGLVPARWGLQPEWAVDERFGRKNAYNARSETLSEKPTFRAAYRHRRCIVPASAFYERADGRWLRISPKDGELFLIAGLWEPENERTGGLPSYTLVTTEPNEVVARSHDRMPVLLDLEAVGHWLDPKADPGDLYRLLTPCPGEWVHLEDAGPVSRAKEEPPALF